MRLTTDRLLIREVEGADLVAQPAEYRDTDLDSPERVRSWVHEALASLDEQPRAAHDFVLLAKETGKMIGRAGLRRSPREKRDGQCWFVIDPREWNKGFVTEAAHALFDVYFGELGMHRVWGECNPHYAASVKMMEKLGMTREAVFRENVFIEGGWKDTAVYALLETEWRAAKKP
jgi:[ribosomal protein S5]-alanine N-acetyltransferase